MLARVRFKSLTGKKLRLYVLADPAPGNDGNDDRWTSSDGQLLALDDVAASAVAAEPRLRDDAAATAAARAIPWHDLQDDIA